ncbi:MAG TPA: hypothetical protein DCS06_03955 [Candidatus Yanofskybacteria bacterium]|nr:MAG: hypothetical protein A2457_01960 [Candidatus Yanofskybacteria bacterium RIFOXYC2_FULL_44_13]HAU08104.1 hypothetical protein [Candidatus Yanofskybacteria bacterium]
MNKKIVVVGFMALAMLLPLFAFALPVPTNPIDSGSGGGAITMAEITNLIQAFARWLIVISVVIAVIMIIWGGIMYMWAKGDDKKVADAQARIKNGIIGAAIVLAVGVILQTVAALVNRSFFSGL